MDENYIENEFSRIRTKLLNMPYHSHITHKSIKYLLDKFDLKNINNDNVCNYDDNKLYKLAIIPNNDLIKDIIDGELLKEKILCKLIKLSRHITNTSDFVYDAKKYVNLLKELLVQRIQNYHIIIYSENNLPALNLNNFTNDGFIADTYLYYSLLKLVKVAYETKSKFKIYSMTENEYNELKLNNMKNIDHYNAVELGTEEQMQYYNKYIEYIYINDGLITILIDVMLQQNIFKLIDENIDNWYNILIDYM